MLVECGNNKKKWLVVDREIFSRNFHVERKLLFFDLRENRRGRFLRITEDVAGRRDAVIIPAAGLEQLRDVVDDLIKANVEAAPADASTET